MIGILHCIFSKLKNNIKYACTVSYQHQVYEYHSPFYAFRHLLSRQKLLNNAQIEWLYDNFFSKVKSLQIKLYAILTFKLLMMEKSKTLVVMMKILHLANIMQQPLQKSRAEPLKFLAVDCDDDYSN